MKKDQEMIMNWVKNEKLSFLDERIQNLNNRKYKLILRINGISQSENQHSILNNQEKYLTLQSVRTPNTKRLRTGDYPQLDQCVYLWLIDKV